MSWISVDVSRVFDPREHPALARELLRDLPKADFRSQFVARRIRKIGLWSGLKRSNLLGGIRPKGDGFSVVLDPDISIQEQLFTLGHEIAHTYLFFPVSVKGSCRFARVTHFCDCEEIEEDFCEEFSKQWVVTHGNQREFPELLQANLRWDPNKQLVLVVKVALDDMDPAGLQDFTPRELVPQTLTPEEEKLLPF